MNNQRQETKHLLNLYISHEIENADAKRIEEVIKALEKNMDEEIHISLNTSKVLMLSKDYKKQFKDTFGVEFNSKNLRNMRLNQLDQSDAMVVIQTSSANSLTSLEVGYNLNRETQPLPMIFIVNKSITREPYESLQKEFPDLPVEVLTFEDKLENELRKWLIESSGFKKRNLGKLGLTMSEVQIRDQNEREEAKRLGQMKISNIDVEGTQFNDRFENPESNESPDLAKKATFHLQSAVSMTGYSFGADISRSGEAVFQTSMVSYPEMLTDPSYKDQIIICSSVILGQYGIPARKRDRYGLLEHFESEEIHCAGLVITDYSFNYSHFQAVQSLSNWLTQYNVPAIYGYEVDTRSLILKIRDNGSELAKIVRQGDNPDDVPFHDPNSRNLSHEVGVKKPVYYEGTGNFKVILVDFGVKNSIIRNLLDHSLSVLVVPWNYDYTNEQYDGIMLSNGPGDPRLLDTPISILKKQMKKDDIVPIFGVCMGNQILSSAAGAKIYKLSYGNRGHNQPVVDISTGKCYVTSQNHGFAVDQKTLPADWQAYFINLNDHSNEGIRHVTKPYFSVQFHPEACGGPWDTRFLFDIFFRDIVNNKFFFGKKSMLKLVENPTFHLLPGQQIIDHTDSEAKPYKLEFFEKRKRIKSVLIIGSGPLQIGQAGEFDYSGCQAIIAMKEEKISTILVNSNIATVQTRAQGMADKVYLVPLTVQSLTEIIDKERPEGLLLGFGGQTALNLGIRLEKLGILQQYNVKVLGTPISVIEDTEDRELFNKRLLEINEPIARSFAAVNTEEAIKAAHEICYPVICRAAYTLGGLGSGFAENDEELMLLCNEAFIYSPQVLIEKDLRGWKELEYEVVRDAYDNCITPAALENINPMGIHTGESIVITPLMTITDEEHFYLRRKAIKIVRHLGVVGECNIQFALNPRSHEVYVIEVNARLSRSSALASKATCYPLAYIAAKIALGHPLPKIPNIVTSITTSFFEPSLDYVVIKIPRWDLTKFNGVSRKIGSMMKSVGEIMSIGRNFEEALQKGLRMVNPNVQGFTWCPESKMRELFKDDTYLAEEFKNATDNHIYAIFQAFYQGWSVDKISQINKIDHWFLSKLERLVQIHKRIEKFTLKDLPANLIKEAKQAGFSDKQIGMIINAKEIEIRNYRRKHNIIPYVKKIDTLGGEFPCVSNNLYLSYNASKDEIDFKHNDKGVIVVGSGCYRIGSSVEFDWCGVELIKEIRENLKVPTIMINNNPETVSTDHTTCDKLYFEEISVERVLDIYEKENPHGVVLSFGGQFPNNLAIPLSENGVHILGTTAHSVDMAEDRAKFSQLCHDLNIHQPAWTEFTDISTGLQFANKVGFPVILRPSYVLSGAAMRLVYNENEFTEMLIKACDVSPDKPVVISKYVEDAMEVDFDGVALNGEILVYAISQHIESAGIHSGDSSLVLPAPDIKSDQRKQLIKISNALTHKLNVNGPFNIQFLYKEKVYQVIEMNLRASRSFPFISKVLGINFMNVSAKVLLDPKNASNVECDPDVLKLKHFGVKCPKFSFKRLAGSDPILGLEMASTGESGCIGTDPFDALLKSLLSTDIEIPEYGNIIIISEMEKALNDYSLFFKYLIPKNFNFYFYLANSVDKPNEYEGLANKISFEEADYMISTQKVQLAFSFAKPSPAIFMETPQSILRKKLFTYRIPTILDPNLACWFSQAIVNDAHLNIKYNVSLQEYLGIDSSPKRKRIDSCDEKKDDVLKQIMKKNQID